MGLESPRIWLKRIHEGTAVKDRWLQKTNPFVDGYNGKFPASIPGVKGTDQISHNYVLTTTRAAIDATYLRNPRVVIPARRPQDQAVAHVASGILNRVMEETGVEESAGEVIRDARLRGSGYFKVGYHGVSAPKPDEEVI